MRSRFTRPRRGGFTAIEMLVVVSIVAILATMTTAAVLRIRAMGPLLATKSNLRSIKSTLDTQWKAVRDKAARETPAGTNKEVFIQMKLTQAFPTKLEDLFDSTKPAPWSGYITYLSGPTVNITTLAQAKAVPQDVQRAVCLMMILERGPSNANVTPESLGSTAARPLDLGNGKQAFGCVDAWGNPLLFTLSATGQPAMTPVILSAGNDKKYGVDYTTFAPLAPTPPAVQNFDPTDNITTLNLN